MLDRLFVPIQPGAPGGQRRVGQCEGRVIRDHPLQSGNCIGKFSLIFEGFSRSVPVVAGRHDENFLGKKSIVAAV
jgi:hypothetical protein